jgi:MFS family permease
LRRRGGAVKLPRMGERRSWPIPILALLAGGLILAFAIGIRQSFGLWLPPMSDDLGWGREVFALAIAVQNLLWGLSQPAFGWAADRWGAGRVVAVGALLYAGGVYLMGQTASIAGFYLSAGLLVGLGLSGISFAVVLGAVGRAFPPERRSMALGVTSACGSIGQFVMVPLGQHFIATYGWSLALSIVAVLSLVMVALSPGIAGKPVPEATRPSEPPQPAGRALAEAAGHVGYLYLTAGFFVCGFHITFIATHLPAYLVDLHLTPEVAAVALSLIGLFNIAGSLLCGVLGQRFSKKRVLAGLYTVRGLAIAVFVLTPASPWSAYIFTAVMGLTWLGTVPLTSALVAQIFGPRYLGTLFGVVFLSHQVGAFVGVWLGGLFYDLTGSYDVVWWLAVGLAAAAALLHMPIDERPVVHPRAA